MPELFFLLPTVLLMAPIVFIAAIRFIRFIFYNKP